MQKKQSYPGSMFLRSFVERETKEIFCLFEQKKAAKRCIGRCCLF